MPVFFDPESYATVEAACERLIPAAEGHPGATALGVADYIDGLLGAFAVDPPRIWAGGPFSGRHGGEASFGTFLRLSRLEELAWRTRIEGSQGIAERELNGPVTGWQQRVPRRDRRARRRLRRRSPPTSRTRASTPRRSSGSCCTGTPARALYGAPEYGGNRDLAGWAAIGFPGDVQPRGYTDEEVTGRD